MYPKIFAYERSEPDSISPEYFQAAAYARTQGIPESRTQVTHYQYDLGTQESVKPGEKRQMLPSRNSTSNLDIFSADLENLLSKPIKLLGQPESVVEGFVNQPPIPAESLLYKDARPLRADELQRMSRTVLEALKSE